MKYFGVILVGIGVALLVFVAYMFLKDRNRVISPVPDRDGIKVIYLTPSPEVGR